MNEVNQQDSQNAWEPCPPGTLEQAVAQINARSQRESLKRSMRVGGGFCAILLVVVAGSLFLNRGGPNFGGISCRQCAGYMEQFYAETLDPVVATKVRTHLENCVDCQEYYEKSFSPPPAPGEVALAANSSDDRLLRSGRRTPGMRTLVLATAPAIK